MSTEDFNYDLPERLIAQTPLKDRSSSKLLVMDRDTGEIEHKHFTDIIDYLVPGDVLVINDTKVIPARLIGEKEETKAVIELLLLKELGSDEWECLSRPFKRLHVGTKISFGNGLLEAIVTEKKSEGIVRVKFIYQGIFLEILDKFHYHHIFMKNWRIKIAIKPCMQKILAVLQLLLPDFTSRMNCLKK